MQNGSRDPHDIKVWSGDRLVARLRHKRSKATQLFSLMRELTHVGAVAAGLEKHDLIVASGVLHELSDLLRGNDVPVQSRIRLAP